MSGAVFCGLLAGAFWGTVFIYPLFSPSFSSIEQMLARYLPYAIFALIPVLLKLKTLLKKTTATDWKTLFLLAAIGNVFYYPLLSIGVLWAGVTAASLIIGLIPVVVVFMSRHEQDAVSLKALRLPLVLIVLGMLFVNWAVFLSHPQSHTVGISNTQKVMGMLCACGAMYFWSYYSYLNAKALKERPYLSDLEWNALTGIATGVLALVMIPVAWWIQTRFGQTPLSLHLIPNRPWLQLFFAGAVLAFFASFVGAILWNKASRKLPSTLSGQLIVSETVFAILYGFVWESRLPTLLEVLAIGCLVVGVIKAIRAH
jgi:drug/metabolite transporter (DMT)-like permease